MDNIMAENEQNTVVVVCVCVFFTEYKRQENWVITGMTVKAKERKQRTSTGIIKLHIL